MKSKINTIRKLSEDRRQRSSKRNVSSGRVKPIHSTKSSSRKWSQMRVCVNGCSEYNDEQTILTNNIEIETLWGEEDESIIQALVDRWKMLEGDQLQIKLDFYYKSLGIETDSIPVQPMKFDSEEPDSNNHQEMESFYKIKAHENWRRLSKAITSKDSNSFRTLIKSVNSYMYPQLKEFVKIIMSPEFQTVMTFLQDFPELDSLDDKLHFAKSGIEKLNKVLGIDNYEFYNPECVEEDSNNDEYESDDSLISSLLLLKRSKLEEVVKNIINYQQKSKKKHIDNLTTKIMWELSKKNLPIPKLADLTRRAKSNISTKTVPACIQSSKLVCFDSSKPPISSKFIGNKRHHTKVLSRVIPKSSKNWLNSINEDYSSDYYGNYSNGLKQSEDETASVSSFNSFDASDKMPENLDQLTYSQIKLS